jgi:endonuclease/exonuclease/phosphatase family metal-dependent hydrolase
MMVAVNGIAADIKSSHAAATRFEKPTLTLVTLNLAHGRKNRLNQLLVSSDTIRENLHTIAELIRERNADVVALQEADGPSFWSGNFDHVGYLAEASEYPVSVRSDHVESWLVNFGTGFLSRAKFNEVISHDFPRSPPTLRKGFTLVQVDWQPEPGAAVISVDLLSVHLDFSRKKVRDRQIHDILTVMKNRSNPVIILGDFNSEWPASESVIRKLAECGGSKVYRPEAKDLGTYKSGKYRLDWVLISDELDFRRYEVIQDVVSDHQPIEVEIAYIGPDTRVDRKTKPEDCEELAEKE